MGALLEQEQIQIQQAQVQQAQAASQEATRQGASPLAQTWINLSQWLQQHEGRLEERIEAGWQTLEMLFGTAPDSLAFSFRSAMGDEAAEVRQGKLIEFTAIPKF